jgi:hypothetical protein
MELSREMRRRRRLDNVDPDTKNTPHLARARRSRLLGRSWGLAGSALPGAAAAENARALLIELPTATRRVVQGSTAKSIAR